MGDYRPAEEYLFRAQREGNGNSTVIDMLEKIRAAAPPPARGARK
jgi:hypothetical protein